MQHKFQMRRARDQDIDFVRRLSAEVFRRFGDYESLLPSLIGSPWVSTTIAVDDGGPVGFSMLSLEQAAGGEFDLVAIAVLPGRQRRGTGSRLLAHAEAEALRSARTDRPILRLTVAEDNAPARELFRQAGFVVTPGERGRYSGGQRSIGLHKLLNAKAL